MTLVALRSSRSVPADLPVSDGVPNTPRMSSRSWKASPMAAPYPERASITASSQPAIAAPISNGRRTV